MFPAAMPKQESCAEHSASKEVSQDWTGVRSVMMQNIPCRCRYEEVTDAIKAKGFEDHVAALHLPMKNARNAGYCFVHFLTPGVAPKFRDAMDGYSFQLRKSAKRVKVFPARVQGPPPSREPSVVTCQMEATNLMEAIHQQLAQKAMKWTMQDFVAPPCPGYVNSAVCPALTALPQYAAAPHREDLAFFITERFSL
eukprot:gb/GFBE01070393.1/.p1 GENE.gb/GFBE01070393.1/~~gb/GFBE01070393.1/.p1  ORF type:complete len:196 (+),score=36.21 gb/GFBE01070393.1/:1-588(+)